jgi:hypothetical protein
MSTEAGGARGSRAAMSAGFPSNVSISSAARTTYRPRRCNARCVLATAGTAVALAIVFATLLGVMVRPAMGAASTAQALRRAAQPPIPAPVPPREAASAGAASAPFKPPHAWHRSNIILVGASPAAPARSAPPASPRPNCPPRLPLGCPPLPTACCLRRLAVYVPSCSRCLLHGQPRLVSSAGPGRVTPVHHRCCALQPTAAAPPIARAPRNARPHVPPASRVPLAPILGPRSSATASQKWARPRPGAGPPRSHCCTRAG